MSYSPLRTGDPVIDRNLDAIKAALDSLSKGVDSTPSFSTYSLLIRGAVSNPTKGTLARDLASYYEFGGVGVIAYNFSQTTAGTAGSGLYTFSLPPGRAFDERFLFTGSEVAQGVVGSCEIVDGGAAYNGVVLTASPTTVSLKMQDPTAGSGVLFDINSSNAPLSHSNISYSFLAVFPVKKV